MKEPDDWPFQLDNRRSFRLDDRRMLPEDWIQGDIRRCRPDAGTDWWEADAKWDRCRGKEGQDGEVAVFERLNRNGRKVRMPSLWWGSSGEGASGAVSGGWTVRCRPRRSGRVRRMQSHPPAPLGSCGEIIVDNRTCAFGLCPAPLSPPALLLPAYCFARLPVLGFPYPPPPPRSDMRFVHYPPHPFVEKMGFGFAPPLNFRDL